LDAIAGKFLSAKMDAAPPVQAALKKTLRLQMECFFAMREFILDSF
jgi:hypothetical protein